MTTMPSKLSALLFYFLFIASVYSCSKDTSILTNSETETAQEQENETEEETTEENSPESTACTDPLDYIFNEKEGLVFVEFENAEFSEDWKLKQDGYLHTGTGYMIWEGSQNLSNPGTGTATFKIKIANTGVYQFIWYSAVRTGNSGTDHNDTWLRFADADDFYGQNNNGSSTVYPKGTGKTPNPEGASSDGWFKIYRSGNDLDFKWQSSTFDNNAHNIFVQFANPGIYLMEISARSSGHGIDKFVLFNDSMTKDAAISSIAPSVISCD
ncbi:MAG: hypothetical protein ABJN95_12010 [Maribacter sp.]|uniref:hypothetical protein n=1 Tax=Maribacter sp. TaxID=1897614 RepID=UPI00329957C2